MKQLEPVSKISKCGDLEDVYFDLTIMIDKDNIATIVDNSKEDYKELVDCNTLIAATIKLSV